MQLAAAATCLQPQPPLLLLLLLPCLVRRRCRCRRRLLVQHADGLERDALLGGSGGVQLLQEGLDCLAPLLGGAAGRHE